MADNKKLANQTSAKDNKKKIKKEKKPNKVAKFFSNTFAELKKVSWPKMSTTVKQTGIVLAFVVIFLVVIFLIDRVLGFGYDSLINLVKKFMS